MDSETPTGTRDGEALSVDHLVALVRRLEPLEPRFIDLNFGPFGVIID